MTLQNQMRAWSYGRQRLDRSATDPLTALEALIAVHGTHPPAPLSLLARTPGFEYAAYNRLIQDRQAINFATMRGSVHLQPTRFAPNLLAATKSNPAALRKRLGVDDKEGLLRRITASAAGENWVSTLLSYLLEALLTAPAYGGNTDQLGWRWLQYTPGFPLPGPGTRYPELPL